MATTQQRDSPGSGRRAYRLALGVAVLTSVVLIAVAGGTGSLIRDEAIYAYGGQQLVDGVPPYVSIFDAKGPFAFVLSAVGTVVARVVGVSDLSGIRLVFALSAVLAAAGVFCLAHRVFGSLPGAVVAAASFATYEGWVRDALSGPDAKTPMVAFLVWALVLLCGRSWALAGAATVLAASTWQPAVLPLLASAVVVLAVQPRGTRWRATARTAAGAGAVAAAYLLWLGLAGALDETVEAALVFPLTGVQHADPGIGERVAILFRTADRYYGVGGVVLVAGTAALAVLVVRSAVVLARRRGERQARDVAVVTVLAPAFLVSLAYALYDFQGYPDAFPLLPFASVGVGGVVAVLVDLLGAGRGPAVARAAVVAVGAVTVAGLVVAGVQLSEDPQVLRASQTSWACALADVAPADGDLWALGDPTPLVLTGLTNPDRYVYLASGVDAWKVDRLPGGRARWEADVVRQAPTVVMIKGIDPRGATATSFTQALRAHGYVQRFLGRWSVLVPAEVAASRPLQLTTRPTPLARDRAGRAILTC